MNLNLFPTYKTSDVFFYLISKLKELRIHHLKQSFIWRTHFNTFSTHELAKVLN